MILTVPTGPNAERSAVATHPERTDCWVLHERARRYDWSGAGPLSIKTFSGGSALYGVGRGYHAVDDSSYLVLNQGQNYSIHIEANEPVESFCIFFAPGFAEQAQWSLTSAPGELLDNCEKSQASSINFFEKTYPHDRLLSPAMFRFRREYKAHLGETGWLVERLHGLVERLLGVHELATREAHRLPSLRPATREELYRRVCRARDYAAAMFASRLTLSELSSVACLSPNHLLRTFRQAFGLTPHQYLTQRRLEQAKVYLVKTEKPVTDICFEVGFESLGSFGSLFRERFGIPPSAFRLRAQRQKKVIFKKPKRRVFGQTAGKQIVRLRNN